MSTRQILSRSPNVADIITYIVSRLIAHPNSVNFFKLGNLPSPGTAESSGSRTDMLPNAGQEIAAEVADFRLADAGDDPH